MSGIGTKTEDAFKAANSALPDLKSKALVASKSVYGPAAGAAVSWTVTHYGLGWDPDTCAEASGLVVLAVSALLRAVTSIPITGVFRK